MATITFDTQELVNELKQNGFTLEQSEAVISVLKKAQSELATKQDLIQLEQRLLIKLGLIIFASFGLFAALLWYLVK